MQKGEPRKIIYFGHSQGNQQFFAALAGSKAQQTFLARNTEHFVALAPIVFLSNLTGLNAKVSWMEPWLYSLTKYLGINEMSYSDCSHQYYFFPNHLRSYWKRFLGWVSNLANTTSGYRKIWGAVRDSCD
jgi:hypothetical protein